MQFLGMYFQIALRNALRQKRRSLLVAVAIALGLASMILADGMMRGLQDLMLAQATETFMGEAQIHCEGFLDTLAMELALDEQKALKTLVYDHPRVAAVSPRQMTQAMISSSYHAEGVMLYGIDPGQEASLSLLDEATDAGEGHYLKTGSDRGILLGKALAKKLRVGLGERVVVTAPEAGAQGIAQAMFRVEGLFYFGARAMDEGMVFITHKAFTKLTSMPEGLHELAIRFHKNEKREVINFFAQSFPRDWEVKSWRQLLPSLLVIFEMSDVSMGVMALILFLVIALTVMNTLFQALYERSFEFGVMRAVGTRPRQISFLIFLEATCLALLSIPMGLCLGLGVNYLLSIYGLDYQGAEFLGIAFTKRMHSEIAWPQYTLYPLMAWVLTLLAAAYPAFYAAKLNPAKALQKSL